MADEAQKAGLIADFAGVTGVDADRAKFYLESSGWQLQIALGSFYDNDGGNDGVDDDVLFHEVSDEFRPSNLRQPEVVDLSAKETETEGAPLAVRGTGRNRPPAPSFRFHTVSDFARDTGADSDSDEEGQAFYAGGADHGSYYVLILGRVLGGISTSLLFTAYEAWYLHEHVETHDFPKEWVTLTFSQATFWNGILAIGAGVVSNFLVDPLHLGPVSPFLLAIPLLLGSGAVVASSWNENTGAKKVKISKACTEGLRHIVGSRRMLLIGAMQSLFESVMYIFIFIWTPVLDQPPDAPLGLIFSSFMACIMIGSYLYELLSHSRLQVPAYAVVNGSIVLAMVSTLTCVLFYRNYDSVSYLAFLLLELACGLYFPSMGFLRGKVLPETHRAGIMNWFRVPLNLIACVLLMVLHGDSSREGTRHIFIICSSLLAVAFFCGIRFARLVKDDESLKPGATEQENGNDGRNGYLVSNQETASV